MTGVGPRAERGPTSAPEGLSGPAGPFLPQGLYQAGDGPRLDRVSGALLGSVPWRAASLPARPLAAAQSKYQDPHINPRTPSCLLVPSGIKQALKLLTFRPVTLLVSGGGSVVGAGGTAALPEAGRFADQHGHLQAGAAPPEASPGARHPGESKQPLEDPPSVLRCQCGPAQTAPCRAGRLPHQGQEEAWGPPGIRKKTSGAQLSFLARGPQAALDTPTVREFVLSHTSKLQPRDHPSNWMPPKTPSLLKSSPGSPPLLPPPQTFLAPPPQRPHQPTCSSSQRPGSHVNAPAPALGPISPAPGLGMPPPKPL